MTNLTYSCINVLNSHAILLQSVCGKVTHQELKAEAKKLKDMGILKEQVDAALFRVETIHNIAA